MDGSLNYNNWEALLPCDDFKRDFILTGVKQGFNIISPESELIPVETENYKSATGPQYKAAVEKQITEEILNNRYIISKDKPTIVSALGAIPKKDGSKVRLIHDCSRPLSKSVNDYAEYQPFTYQSLQDAIDLIEPHYYLAKLDLASAYRSVKINAADYKATGLKWTFTGDSSPTYLIDTRLPFGARSSPSVFNELSQAVRRIMAAQGVPSIIVYLDDFLVIAESQEKCQSYLAHLMKVLRQLGFAINYNKVTGPCKRLTFLGITLDTENMTIELPSEKISDLKLSLITTFNKHKVTKRNLQSLAGKLNYATQCIYGGRFFLRRILDCIGQLRLPWHRTRVTQAIRNDISWWLQFLEVFNGQTKMVDCRPQTPVCIDACPEAAGGYHGNEFVYTSFRNWPGSYGHHINYKETLALEPAVKCWAHTWRNKKVHIYCDNQAAVAIMNKGSCKDPFVMESLRRVFWYSVKYNFRIKATYLPGTHNQIADSVSRLHDPISFNRLAAWYRIQFYKCV